MNKILVICQIALGIAVASCGTSSSEDESILGYRYQVSLVRHISELEWSEVKGEQQWWFFAAGVFRQISTDYIEPDFFGEAGRCNSEAVGTFSYEESKTDDGNDYILAKLEYSGKDTAASGLCRSSDRELGLVLQPSLSVDLIDGDVVQRLNRLDKIR